MKGQDLARLRKAAAEACNAGAVFSLMFLIVFVLLLVMVLVTEFWAKVPSPWWFNVGILGYAGGMALGFFIYYLIKKRDLRALGQEETVVRPLP